MFALPEVGEQVFNRFFRVALPVAQPAECGVHNDTVQPCAELRFFLEPADSLEGGKKSILHRVVGVFFMIQHAAGNEQ